MSPLNRIFALSIALLISVPVATAQESEGWFSEFHFDQLKFVFWPGGVENRQDSDGKGSALTVNADKVAITDWDALDVRHCIDGDDSWCSYPELAKASGGNQDGEVTQNEVESFQTFAQIGLRSQIDKVDQLADTLQSNITIDGIQAKSVKIMKVVLHDVVGTVDSNETIYADVEAKATYDNDKGASSHKIHIGELKLRDDGFVYKTTMWAMGASGWKYDTAGTNPSTAKPFVTDQGFYASQEKFEALSQGGIDLATAKGDGGKGKSPGVEAIALIGLLAIIVGLRRRK